MLTIEKVRREDLPRLVELIREFAAFERLGDVCEVTERGLDEALLTEDSPFRCVLAFSEGEPVGYAVFYPVFKTFRGVSSMYLEDLYVVPASRGRGYGTKILKAIAREAAEEGITRLDWQVLRWNEAAVEFYETMMAERDDGNLDYRISGEAFQNLIK